MCLQKTEGSNSKENRKIVISFLKMFVVTTCKFRQTAVGYNLKCPFASEEEFETPQQKDFTE